MNDIALPGRDILESLLRDVALQCSREVLDDLELRHLLEVACNHSLLSADKLADEQVERLINRSSNTGVLMFSPLCNPQAILADEVIHQVGRIPDDIKMIGDKCLYDVGLFGKQAYRGHDLTDLGKRAYELAAEVLEALSDDRRLREFFKQNRMWNLPIDQEIVFLRQCGLRFPVHAEILRDLRLIDRREDVPASTLTSGWNPTEDSTVDTRSARDQANQRPDTPANRPKNPAEGGPRETPPPMGFESLDPSRFPDTSSFGGGVMGERPEFIRDDFGPAPSLLGTEKLPRKDLLSLYERMLLFGALDIEELRSQLKRVVIDQGGAVDALCDELSLYAVGTQNLNRPASYFFVGPTGVGKNHLVETLVSHLEGRWDFEIPFLQLEGPQYTYPSDINELKGAARGFIRSDEEGILTEFYSRSSVSPFSVILVDEVEKSHPQLRKFFLSLMDRGTTMDNRGQMLNFINSMIVYTSNIGYSRMQTTTAPIGFLEETDQRFLRDQEVMRDLKRMLTPEFVNRLTVIKFDPLSRGSIEAIFDLEIERIAARYQTMHSIELTVTPRARRELIRRGYNPEFGARPLARLLNSTCNIEVSKKLKRDEKRSQRADRHLREYIKEVKEGRRAYDAVSMQRRVMGSARVQVPYHGIAVDFDGEFMYLPQGQERGTA